MHTTDRDPTAIRTGDPAAGSGGPDRIRSIVFWAATMVIVGELAAGSVWSLALIDWIQLQAAHLGYPHYFPYVLGTAQVGAAVAIMAPRLPLVKEWAYAGVTFLWTGAVVSHLTLGDGPKTWVPPLVFAVLGVVSWALRPADRRFPETRLPRRGVAREAGLMRSWETRPRAWALPVAVLVVMFAVSIAVLPAADAITREWAVEYGWITEYGWIVE
ncbi:DoxX family protein [Glycomyces terrestris]|uniref:DoxX family protein n=1 Tax=Glycomyces terrestris TaxID=2493553 RepID=A0A426V339_9ACTN|nr:DoxX family protein [Glycomyces terrestris]RRS01324.1 DoxX family protein [Glycomyces terrestris]